MLVVFDLDGTLVDSRQDLADTTNDVLKAYGAAPLPQERVVRMVGDGARMLVQRALEAAGVVANLDDALELFHQSYAPRLLATTRPYPGIDALLEGLGSRVTMALLTNKPLAPSLRMVEGLGWTRHFVQIVGGDGPFPRKPDPAGLRAIAEQAGVSCEQTMMVGDSMADVEVARRAGTAVCVAQYGFGNARGDLVLRGDEWLAASSDALVGVVRDWMSRG